MLAAAVLTAGLVPPTRLLVCGGSGFLGREVCREAVARGETRSTSRGSVRKRAFLTAPGTATGTATRRVCGSRGSYGWRRSRGNKSPKIFLTLVLTQVGLEQLNTIS